MTTIFKRALIQSGIFFCFILIAIPSTYAQDFEQTMVEAMCPCFERISHLESKSFEECLMSKLKPKLSLIIAHYKIDTTNNAFAVGQAFGQRVNRDIQLPLLKGCDAALRLAISQQKDGWNRLKSNSDSANYQLIMSELKTKGETREIVIALGYYYFAHEDFDKATFYANRYIELFQEYKESYSAGRNPSLSGRLH